MKKVNKPPDYMTSLFNPNYDIGKQWAKSEIKWSRNTHEIPHQIPQGTASCCRMRGLCLGEHKQKLLGCFGWQKSQNALRLYC